MPNKSESMARCGDSKQYLMFILLSTLRNEIFVNKKFVNEGSITKFTKILCHENLELYGISLFSENLCCTRLPTSIGSPVVALWEVDTGGAFQASSMSFNKFSLRIIDEN